MSFEEYLAKNFDPELLKQAQEFHESPEFKAIQRVTSSVEYQLAKSELLARDIEAHKNILQEIEQLQKLMFNVDTPLEPLT